MNTWLKALLLFSVPATAISALGIYHGVEKGDLQTTTSNNSECCKKCSEECKNKECCKNQKCCSGEGQQCSESNCSEECCKCCKK